MAKSPTPTTSRGFWERAIARQARSGLTQRAFCAQQALSLHVFRSRKYHGGSAARPVPRSPSDAATAPSFLPVHLVSPGRPAPCLPDSDAAAVVPAPIELVLEHRYVIRIPPDFESRSLLRVIAVLEREGC